MAPHSSTRDTEQTLRPFLGKMSTVVCIDLNLWVNTDLIRRAHQVRIDTDRDKALRDALGLHSQYLENSCLDHRKQAGGKIVSWLGMKIKERHAYHQFLFTWATWLLFIIYYVVLRPLRLAPTWPWFIVLGLIALVFLILFLVLGMRWWWARSNTGRADMDCKAELLNLEVGELPQALPILRKIFFTDEEFSKWMLAIRCIQAYADKDGDAFFQAVSGLTAYTEEKELRSALAEYRARRQEWEFHPRRPWFLGWLKDPDYQTLTESLLKARTGVVESAKALYYRYPGRIYDRQGLIVTSVDLVSGLSKENAKENEYKKFLSGRPLADVLPDPIKLQLSNVLRGKIEDAIAMSLQDAEDLIKNKQPFLIVVNVRSCDENLTWAMGALGDLVTGQSSQLGRISGRLDVNSTPVAEMKMNLSVTVRYHLADPVNVLIGSQTYPGLADSYRYAIQPGRKKGG